MNHLRASLWTPGHRGDTLRFSMTHFQWLLAVAGAALLTTSTTPTAQAREVEGAESAPAQTQRVALESSTTAEGCSLEKFRVVSKCMDREIQAVVVLPPGYHEHPERKYPILYALHGRGAPYDAWSAMAPLRTALKDKPMIVACFDGDKASLYLDSPYPQAGSRKEEDKTTRKSLFTTFFFDEFIPCIDQAYRVQTGQRMLTGFSMGGRGAFHFALTKPGAFVSVSSVSGDFASWETMPPRQQARMENMLGPHSEDPSRFAVLDLPARIQKQKADGVPLPPMYMICGTEDPPQLRTNRILHERLSAEQIPCEYIEIPGAHDWAFFRDASPGVIDFHWRTLQPGYSAN